MKVIVGEKDVTHLNCVVRCYTAAEKTHEGLVVPRGDHPLLAVRR